MAKRIVLPGGSFLDVIEEDDQADAETRRKRLEQRLEADLVHELENAMVDPEEFERDLLSNVDPNLSPFLSGSEDLRAEQALERRAGPAITAALRRGMQRAAAKEDESRSRATIGHLFGPSGRPLEDW